MTDDQNRIDQKEDIAYSQNYETFRVINASVTKTPMMAMAFTAALLVVISTFEHKDIIIIMLLVLTGLANLALIPILLRVRFIIGQMLMQINGYDERYDVKRQCGKWWDDPEIFMKVFQPLLILTALLCFAAALYYSGAM